VLDGEMQTLWSQLTTTPSPDVPHWRAVTQVLAKKAPEPSAAGNTEPGAFAAHVRQTLSAIEQRLFPDSPPQTSLATPPVDDVYAIACPSVRVCAMVGTKWVGSPVVATGAVAQSRDGGATFASSPAAYVPLTLTALDCPDAASCLAAGGATLARVTLVTPVVRGGTHSSTTAGSAQG